MTSRPETNRPAVAFIGLGLMGLPMARRLCAAGYAVHAYDRNPAQIKALLPHGALPVDTPAQAAARAEVLLTMVPEAKDVEAVLTGPDGALSALREGALHIDTSTIFPADCARFSGLLREQGVDFLDAPVSGGVTGAEQGTLSILVGGSDAAYARALPLLSVLGKQITHMGPVGSGQTAKCCNQVIGALTIQAVCEGLLLAEKTGLSLEKLIPAIQGGAADSFMLQYVGNHVLSGNHAPGFRIQLQLKDLDIALQTAAACNAPLPALGLVNQLFRSRAAHGGSVSEGNQALMLVYEMLGNVAPDPAQSDA